MPADLATVLSALAATLAAISSFLIWRIQRMNLLRAARPELTLTEWSRAKVGSGDAAHEVVAFHVVRNVGQGVALHLHFSAFRLVDNRPAFVLPTLRMPGLAPGEAVDVTGDVAVWWKNIKPDSSGRKHISIPVTIRCSDSHNRLHETEYLLFLSEVGMVSEGNSLAPGVGFTTRKTKSRALWWAKLHNHMREFTRSVRDESGDFPWATD